MRNLIDQAVQNLQGRSETLLWALYRANMQLTTAQKFAQVYSGTAYYPTLILYRNRVLLPTVTCAGGISDGTNQIVATGQSWIFSTYPGSATIALTGTSAGPLTAQPSLTLTTGSTAAAIGDILIYGKDVS